MRVCDRHGESIDRVSSATKTLAAAERHVVPLARDWAIWRPVCLRSTGLPIERVIALASPASRAALSDLLEAEQDAERCRTEALNVVRDELRGADRERRAELNKARKDLQRCRAPDVAGGPRHLQSLVGAFLATSQQRDELDRDARAVVSKDLDAERLLLHRLASDRVIHEAMVWQNRHAVHRVRAHLSSAVAMSARERRDELLIAAYVQRYCTKNETIGFFGPLCWLSLRSEHAGIAVSPGTQLARDGVVQFETWALDAVARGWASRFDLKRWLRPRRAPLLRLDDRTLVKGDGTSEPLCRLEVAALRLADGTRTADALAQALVTDPSHGAATHEEVFDVFERLHAQGYITWRFELPVVGQVRALEEQITAIADPAVRAVVLTEWKELGDCRRTVAKAAGDPAAVDDALERAEQAFTRITCLPATRHPGRAYGSRTILRQECPRDIQMTVGDDVVTECGEALGLILESARWFMSRVVERFAGDFEAIHRQLDTTVSGSVDAAPFWLELVRRFPVHYEWISALLGEMHDRWRDVLGPIGPGHNVTYAAADLAPRVAAAFGGCPLRSSYCQYVSVDLQIAADSVEAFNFGTRRYVLGEVHLGHLLGTGLFVDAHPDASVLRAHLDADWRDARVVLVRSRAWPMLSARFNDALELPGDVLVIADAESHGAYDERVLPLADCTVVRRGSQLVLCRRGGAGIAPLTEAFGGLFQMLRVVTFRPFAEAPHVPRVAIDNLVISRETWQLDIPAQCLGETDMASAVIAIARWRLDRGLPRWCFVRVKTERKPIYVDFDSPILSAFLLATMRRAANAGASTVTMTEMLPDPTELWLQDRMGSRYTSEFRLVALDRSPRAKDGDGHDIIERNHRERSSC